MFRYDLGGGRVILREKPRGFLGPEVDATAVQIVLGRAETYRLLLERCLALSHLGFEFSLAIDVADIPPDYSAAPFFAFQKRTGSPCILLPDTDLLALQHLEGELFIDSISFQDKINKAIFVGSTTGASITQESLEALSVPRIRAAVSFRDNPHVLFKLPNVVQCDSPATEAALKAMDLGDRFIEWPEQLGYRHMVSMDGNGATCLRVAAALHSNGALLKYDSPYQLFYFKGLQPWRHYVPITADADVERVVIDSEVNGDRYERIAVAGARFFREHLSRDATERYVATLLRRYAWMMIDAEGQFRKGLPARAAYHAASTRASVKRRIRRAAKVLTGRR